MQHWGILLARRYAEAWQELKKTRSVTLRCHPEKVSTIIQAIKKEKARENAPRIALELPSFGKLSFVWKKVSDKFAEITFKLNIGNRAQDL